MLKSWIVAGVACVALTACEPGTGSAPMASNAASNAAPATTSVRLVDHDVEAPEVFQTSDMGLWDGRPSLGGVWVASADAKNPERVIMRNPANGKFVIGGLFQRDASMPGPKLQLSSDAADALGLVAGQPAKVSVTALRREEAAPAAPDATKPLLDANEAVQPGGNSEVTATAAAAIAKAVPLAGKPAAAMVATAAAGTAPVAKPATPAAGTKPAAPAAKLAVQAAVAAPTAPTASGALIQIGNFSVEANAKLASDVLAKAGITSAIAVETSHGKPMWSVTARGDAALLAKIKSAGFKDAYTLSR